MTARFHLRRFSTDGQTIVGSLMDADNQRLCYALEPGHERTPHPCIPVGAHQLRLYHAGTKNAAYLRRYGPDWHKGMVEVVVPGRSAIEVHVGNTLKDTLGCLLTGTRFEAAPNALDADHWAVFGSRAAYEAAYPVLRDAILAGMTVLRVTEDFDIGRAA